MVFQIQLTKRQDVVPMTRDYIMPRGAAPARAPKASAARRCGWPASSAVRARRACGPPGQDKIDYFPPLIGPCELRGNRIAAPCRRQMPVLCHNFRVSTDIHGPPRFGAPQAGRRTCPALSFRPAQYRGGAGAIGRDPGQQRGLLPGLRFPQSGAFLRADPPEGLSDRARSDPRRQDRDAGHAEDLPRRRHRHRRHDGRANIWRGSPPKPPPSSMPRTTAIPSTTCRSAAR